MNEPTPSAEVNVDLVDRYLDDAMNSDERAAFERRMSDDAALRATVEQIRAANAALAASLAARFALPAESRAVEHVRASAAATPARAIGSARVSWRASWRAGARWYALAAALLLCAGAGLLFQQARASAVVRGEQLVAYYAEQVQLGLTPQWVCKDDKTFREYTSMRFGTPMSFRPLPSGVALIGWTYVRGPMRTDSNAVLMATRDGTPVFVVVERRADASRVSPPQGGASTRIFRRDLEDVTLYELSPLDAPTLLDLLYEVR